MGAKPGGLEICRRTDETKGASGSDVSPGLAEGIGVWEWAESRKTANNNERDTAFKCLIRGSLPPSNWVTFALIRFLFSSRNITKRYNDTIYRNDVPYKWITEIIDLSVHS
jgi:hypothetical protein